MSTAGPDLPRKKARRFALLLVVLLALAAAGAAVFALNDDDDSTSVSTTSSPQSTTAVSSSATARSATPEVDASTAVWPFATGSVRYESPDAAARSFATEYLRFQAPLLSGFQAGDSRSGEVGVQPRTNGPKTTILLRQMSDNNWWVLGATTPNIQIVQPAALSSISSPVRFQGTSNAYEATVQSAVRVDGSVTPVAEGFVMGGSMGELGPFDATLAFPRPSVERGAIVLHTESAENGQVWEAAVVRVVFAR